jgi:hypothetical protein
MERFQTSSLQTTQLFQNSNRQCKRTAAKENPLPAQAKSAHLSANFFFVRTGSFAIGQRKPSRETFFLNRPTPK